MRAFLILCLLTSSAFAQEVTRGDALRRRQYELNVATTLYVATTGNDAGPCSNTQPCATLDGALAKLPRFINANVTIEVAAGTYSAAATIQNFVVARGSTLSINGAALTNVSSIPSGSVTGTLTGYAAASGAAQAYVTDSSQSWPALWSQNDWDVMRGYWLTVTSGAASGTSRLITQSRGTELGLIADFTSAPSSGDTYAIQTTATNLTGQLTIRNFDGALTIRQLGVITTTATPVLFSGTAPTLNARITFVFCRIATSGAARNIETSSQSIGYLQLTDTAVISPLGANGTATIQFNPAAEVSIGMQRVYANGRRSVLTVYRGYVSLISVAFDSTNITENYLLRVFYGSRVVSLNTWLTCIQRPPVNYWGGVSGFTALPGTMIVSAVLSIDGCARGIYTSGYVEATTSAVISITNSNASNYLSGNTGGVVVERGGVVDLSGASAITLSGNGSDGGVDFNVCGEQIPDALLSTFPAGQRSAQKPCGTVIR